MKDGQPGQGRLSIRARLIVAIMVLVAAGLLVVGGTVCLVERRVAQERAAAALHVEAQTFAALAASGTDPATGEPFADLAALLRVSLQHHAFAPDDGALGIVDGRIRWTAPDGVSLRLEDLPGFVDTVLPLAERDATSEAVVTVDGHRFVYVVAPVRMGTQSGALVRAVDLGVAGAQLNATMATFAVVGLGVLLAVASVTALVADRLLRRSAGSRRRPSRSARTISRGVSPCAATTISPR